MNSRKKEITPSSPYVGKGSHICLIYETEAEYRSFVLPFLKQGIDAGEKVVYATDVHSREEITGMLADLFPGGDRGLLQTQFHILSSRETYLRYRCFDPDGMVEILAGEIQLALEEGYSGLRTAGEMSWALSGALGTERLAEYEEKLDKFLEGKNCICLCMYDLKRFPPETLVETLRSHGLASAGSPLKRNVFHRPARSPGNSADRLKGWLSYFRTGEPPGMGDIFHDFVSNVPGIIYRCSFDKNWTMEFISDEVENLTGYPAREFIGNATRSYASIIHEGDRGRVMETVEEGVRNRKPYSTVYRLTASDGSVLWVEEKGRGVYSAGGGLLYLDGVITDITGVKRSEDEKRELLEKIGMVLSSTKTNIDIIDSDYNLLYVDPGWEKVYGDFPGKKCYEYFFKTAAPCPGCRVGEAFRTGKPAVATRVLPGEANRAVQVTTVPFKDRDGRWAAAEMNTDISRLRETAGNIDYLAVHDKLTGLYTRAFIEAEFPRIDCESNLPLGIILLELKDSGSSTEIPGSSLREEIIVKVSELVRNSCRGSDLAARWDDNRFIMLMPYTSGRRLNSLARSLKKSAAGIKAREGKVSLAEGLSVKGSAEEALEDVIARAEKELEGKINDRESLS